MCMLSVALLSVLFCGSIDAQTAIEVSSLSELRKAVQRNNQAIVMKAGRYALTELPDGSRDIQVSESDNTIVTTESVSSMLSRS